MSTSLIKKTESKAYKDTVEELTRLKILEPHRDKWVETLAKGINSRNPIKMRRNLALFGIMHFVGHFKPYFELEPGINAEVNLILMMLAGSGFGKSSSWNAVEHGLSNGTKYLHALREAPLRARAEELGVLYDERELIASPLITKDATPEGLVATLFRQQNPTLVGKLGVINDEYITSLKSNQNFDMVSSINAELFDSGNMGMKLIKDVNSVVGEIKNMGISSLLMGSPDNLFTDKDLMVTFKEKLQTQYARRCEFINPIMDESVDMHESGEERVARLIMESEEAGMFRKQVSEHSENLAMAKLQGGLMTGLREQILLTPEIIKIHKHYETYVSYGINSGDNELVRLSNGGRAWRVLKVACGISFFNGRRSVSVEDYRSAVTIAEENKHELKDFLKRTERQPYQKLIDLVKAKGVDGLKMFEADDAGILEEKQTIQELIIVGNTKIKSKAVLTLDEDNTIRYKTYPPVDLNNIKCSGSKQEVQHVNAYIHNHGVVQQEGESLGHMHKRVRSVMSLYDMQKQVSIWSDYTLLMQDDIAYSAFTFRGNTRLDENIEGGADFAIIDVDDSEIHIDDMAEMLMEYNFHMATTSNVNNKYKYRILIPFKFKVEVNSTHWLRFMKELTERLCINADILPRNQAILGYKGAYVLSNPTGDVFDARGLVELTRRNKVTPTIMKLSEEELSKASHNISKHFGDILSMPKNEAGTKDKMFRIMAKAKDLGMSFESNEHICELVASKELSTIDVSWFNGTLVNQRRKKYGMSR